VIRLHAFVTGVTCMTLAGFCLMLATRMPVPFVAEGLLLPAAGWLTGIGAVLALAAASW
jgi:hypothetical protein